LLLSEKIDKPTMKKIWFDQPLPEITPQFAADSDRVLFPVEASKCWAQQRPNELSKAKGISSWMLFVARKVGCVRRAAYAVTHPNS
jgi:hypothetical protein